MPTDALDRFMAEVRAGLADLKGDSARYAVEYCEEFISEAREAGRPEEEILARIGSVQEIITHARAEAALSGAEKSPGPFRLARAGRQVLRSIADSAARSSLLLAASIPFALTLLFYAAAAAAFIGAIALACVMILGAVQMPGRYPMEIIGTAGGAALSGAVTALAGLLLLRIAAILSRATTGLLRRRMRGNARPAEKNGTKPRKSAGMKITAAVFGFLALAGIGLLAPSGLPVKYFMIWNSVKPVDAAENSWTFKTRDVRRISASTMNTDIVIQSSGSGTGDIRVRYEEPPWLTGDAALENGEIVFKETSRGMLPFMDFIARHRGTTALVIEVPSGFRANVLEAQSIGGCVTLAVPAGSSRVETNTGAILFTVNSSVKRITAAAPEGGIIVNGAPMPGTSYAAAGPGAGTAELASTGGRIEIR